MKFKIREAYACRVEQTRDVDADPVNAVGVARIVGKRRFLAGHQCRLVHGDRRVITGGCCRVFPVPFRVVVEDVTPHDRCRHDRQRTVHNVRRQTGKIREKGSERVVRQNVRQQKIPRSIEEPGCIDCQRGE